MEVDGQDAEPFVAPRESELVVGGPGLAPHLRDAGEEAPGDQGLRIAAGVAVGAMLVGDALGDLPVAVAVVPLADVERRCTA